MENDPLQAKIDELKSILESLTVYSFPEYARLKLGEAHQILTELAQDPRFQYDQNRLSALYRVSQMLGASLDLDVVLTKVIDAVIGLTGSERGFLVLVDTDSPEWEIRAARNFSEEALSLEDMGVSHTLIDQVIHSGKGLVTNDAQTDPRFANVDSVIIHALRSGMCAPLLVRGQSIGAIYVDNRAHAGLFSDRDLELLNAFAGQAAIAIENARLYTRTDQALAQRVAELETLAQFNRELTQQLDIEYVAETTRKWMLRVGKADQVGLLVVGEADSDEKPFTAYPPGFDALNDPLLARAQADALPQQSPPESEFPARLAIPMLHAGKSLGIISLERPALFSSNEIVFLMHLAGRAAVNLENARLYQAVQQANQAKSKFVSVVTHELRIPMTSIKGYTDLLRQGVVGPVNEQQINFLIVVRNNVERMNTLVSDLSDISRIETGRLKFECINLSVNGYVEETLRSIQPKLQEKNQTLEVSIVPDLPKAYSDPNRLMQILTNLVSNASKYTPSGGKIRVTARPIDTFVCIEVEDNGLGISEQDQQKLFTQFFRSDDPAVREEQGWGLGLSVAKRLAELMGGSMGFSSQLGQGSTFWFTLPTQEGRCKST